MKKEKKPRVEFKGYNPDGDFIRGCCETLDDIKDVGSFFLIINRVDDFGGLPPISFEKPELRYLEAKLTVTASSTNEKLTDSERLGQIITVINSENASPATYSRLWTSDAGGGQWQPWVQQVSGDVTVVAPSNDLNEKLSLLSTDLKNESENLRILEKNVSAKLIKLAGFGTMSEGDTGVTGNGQYFVSTATNKLYLSSDYNGPANFVANEVPFLDGAVYNYNNELYVYNGEKVVRADLKVCEDIVELDKQLSDVQMILGDVPSRVTFEDDKFIALGGTLNEGDVVDQKRVAVATYRCAVISVEKDDVLLLNVVGGSNARAYAFLDEEGRLLYKADENVVLVNERVVVPENAVKMIINDNNSGGVSLMPSRYLKAQKALLFDKNLYTQAYIDNMRMVWNPNYTASYNTLEALTDKVSGMSCRAIFTPSTNGEFTSIALISNPNGVHNVKGDYPELNKPATHINKKSIHPVFTRDACNLGIMREGVLTTQEIKYDTPLVADGVTEYSFGWSVDEGGITVYTPDGKSHSIQNTEDVNYLDYCGKYCCFEFFNNQDTPAKKKACAQPQFTNVEVVQSDGFIIYDNFIRPDGLLGQTPAGFVWHEATSAEGYYSYE